MRMSATYLDTFESAIEVRDAILLRMTIINKMPYKNGVNELSKRNLEDEIEQLKDYLQHRFNKVFGEDI